MTAPTADPTLIDGVRDRASQTLRATRVVVGRLDGLAVAVVTAFGYLLAYLWMTDHLQFRSGTGLSWFVVADPTSRLFDRRGPFSFEPIAVLEFGVGTLLVSPVDLALGLTLAVLVGLNLAFATLAAVQPASCGFGAGAGFGAAVPALLSGSVCCAPMLILILGIQASGTLLTVLPWLLPVGVTLLLASLVYVAGMIDLTAATRTKTERSRR